ncbi:hypothetical protein T12_8019 [Trichinella patagoniensis]|uniref:Uncharacterized protein n=1 Tax=Trichinella patagoniensis TaxID=990121 RepID=A0A0V1AFA2_9BILA|nr:hypothetical protein T12_8019 [Trichinella patagoniensis]
MSQKMIVKHRLLFCKQEQLFQGMISICGTTNIATSNSSWSTQRPRKYTRFRKKENSVKRNGKNVVGEKAEQASQRTTTTADIPVSYKSNRNRHRRAILTDRTRKKAHLDDRRLIFKMARSMLLTGHENGCQRKDTQR